MITFRILFEKLSCAVEILIWSDAVNFLRKSLGMPYSVVTAQQACSTEMVKLLDNLKLRLRQYPAIHTNYIISHYTTLQYNYNVWHER